jgi:hypothetical protein
LSHGLRQRDLLRDIEVVVRGWWAVNCCTNVSNIYLVPGVLLKRTLSLIAVRAVVASITVIAIDIHLLTITAIAVAVALTTTSQPSHFFQAPAASAYRCSGLRERSPPRSRRSRS